MKIKVARIRVRLYERFIVGAIPCRNGNAYGVRPLWHFVPSPHTVGSHPLSASQTSPLIRESHELPVSPVRANKCGSLLYDVRFKFQIDFAEVFLDGFAIGTIRELSLQ